MNGCGCYAITVSISMQFSPLPSLPTPVSLPENSSHGLGGYYSLASGVVNTVRPGRLPHNVITEIVSVTIEQLNLEWDIPPSQNGTQSIINEFLIWLAPAIAAVTLGLLLAVVIPVMGCCIVCCRKNGHCGAKSRIYHKKHQNVKCFVYTCVFMLSNAMIIIGAILGVVSASHLSTSLRELDSTVDSTLSDGRNYLNGGGKQIKFIATTQFDVFEKYVLDDLNEIGQWFEEEIEDELHFDAVISNASSFLEVLMEIDNITTSGNILIRDLKTLTSNLTLQISTLNESLSNLATICNFSSLCDFLLSTEFTVNVDYTNISNIEFLDHIDLNEIEEKIKNATDIFLDLSSFIDTEAENYQLTDKTEDEFQRAHDTLQIDYLNTINDTLRDVDGVIEEAHTQIQGALKYLDTYESYWFGVSLVLVSSFFLLVVLFLIGSFCGCFGYNPAAHPHSRSSVSHCGGRFILVGTIIAFITSPLLMITASVSYGLATGIQKLCDELQPPDYYVFSEVTDDPLVWGGMTLVGAITREISATAINISIAQTLRGCEENEAVWKVLDGDNMYSLDFNDAFNCSKFGVGSGDFLPFDGFNSGDIFPNLTDIANSYDDINFDEYNNLTNDTILSFNLTMLEANLIELQEISNDTRVYNLTSQILGDLTSIEMLLSEIQDIQVYVERSVTVIETKIISSQNSTGFIGDLLNDFLKDLLAVVTNATGDYVDRLCGFANNYTDYAQDTIKNDLGRCRALPVAYSGLYSRVCENTLDGLNGYWLSIGWCMLFTIVAVVLGLVLYDYFSRAGTRVVKCTDTSSENTSLLPRENDDVSVLHMSHGSHTHGPNANHLEERQPLHTTQMYIEW